MEVEQRGCTRSTVGSDRRGRAGQVASLARGGTELLPAVRSYSSTEVARTARCTSLQCRP